MIDSSGQQEVPKLQQHEARKPAVETAERPSLKAKFQVLDISPNHPLSPQQVAQMEGFCKRETDLWKQLRETSDPNDEEQRRHMREQMTAQLNHRANWRMLQTELGMNPHIPPLDPNPHVLVSLATDAITKQVIGFSFAFLKETPEGMQVGENYIGRSGEEQYRNRKLGQHLAALGNLALLHLGIDQYDARLGVASLRMMKNSDLTMEEILHLPSEDEQVQGEESHGTHRIQLDEASVERECKKMGFDPSQNPLTATSEVEIP